jgi:hypothetical protein
MFRALVASVALSACGFAPAEIPSSDGATDAQLIGAGSDARSPDGAPVTGALVVTRQIVSGPIDLTAEGTSDWAEWGATTMTEFNHKATGGTQIANWTRIGTATVYGYGNGYNQPGNDGFTWSDGAPLAVESTAQYSGVWINNPPNGFSTMAPASRTTRTLRVYVGGANATGTFTARLSDGSVADYVDVAGIGSASQGWAGCYKLVYNSANDGATIEVSWVQQSTSGGDVNWSAASLQ